MNKIIKAQAGAVAIPITSSLPSVAGVVSKALPIVSKALPVMGGIPGVVASILYSIATDRGSANPATSGRHGRQSVAVPDATKTTRPIVVATPSRQVDLHSYATRTISRPMAVTRTMSAASDSTGTATPRDTTGTAAPQADDRNILQKSDDWLAKRKAKNKTKNNQANNQTGNQKPSNNSSEESNGTGSKLSGYIKRHPIKSTIIGGFTVFEGGPQIWKGIGNHMSNKAAEWTGGEKKDTTDVHKSVVQQQQTEPVQNDTTQAYNGFLINQRNLVE